MNSTGHYLLDIVLFLSIVAARDCAQRVPMAGALREGGCGVSSPA